MSTARLFTAQALTGGEKKSQQRVWLRASRLETPSWGELWVEHFDRMFGYGGLMGPRYGETEVYSLVSIFGLQAIRSLFVAEEIEILDQFLRASPKDDKTPRDLEVYEVHLEEGWPIIWHGSFFPAMALPLSALSAESWSTKGSDAWPLKGMHAEAAYFVSEEEWETSGPARVERVELVEPEHPRRSLKG